MSSTRPKKPSTIHYLSERLHPETLHHFLYATDPKKISPKEYHQLHFMIESYPDAKKHILYATLVGFNLSKTKDALPAEGDSYTLGRYLTSKKTKQPATFAEWKNCKDFQAEFTLDTKKLKEDCKAQFKLLLDTLQDLGVTAPIVRAAGCGNYGRGFAPHYQEAVADAYREVLTEGNYDFKFLFLSEKDEHLRKLFDHTLGDLMSVSDRTPEALAETITKLGTQIAIVTPNSFDALKATCHKHLRELSFKGLGHEAKEEETLEERLAYLNTIASNLSDATLKHELQKGAWQKFLSESEKDQDLIKKAPNYPELFKPYLPEIEKIIQDRSRSTIASEFNKLKTEIQFLDPRAFSEEHLKEAEKLLKKVPTEQISGIKFMIMNKFKEHIESKADTRDKLNLIQSARKYNVCKDGIFTSRPELDYWKKLLEPIYQKQKPHFDELEKLDKKRQELQRPSKPLKGVSSTLLGDSWSSRENLTFNQPDGLDEEDIKDKKDQIWKKIRGLEREIVAENLTLSRK